MDKISSIFAYIKGRLSEPSTYASFAGLCYLSGTKIDPSVVVDVLDMASIGFGALGILLSESKGGNDA